MSRRPGPSLCADVAPGCAIAPGEGYRVRDFRPADYRAVWDAVRAQGWPALQNDPDLMGRLYDQHRAGAWTATLDGEVLACAGVVRGWQGFGIAWVVITPEARDRHALVLARMLMRHFPDALRGLRRLEADVLEGQAVSEGLVERLGFVKESRMLRYGPNGETFGKWVILPPEETVARETAAAALAA